MMGLGKDKGTLMGAFTTKETEKRERKIKKEFANQEVFGLTGKLVKRSKGFGQ